MEGGWRRVDGVRMCVDGRGSGGGLNKAALLDADECETGRVRAICGGDAC